MIYTKKEIKDKERFVFNIDLNVEEKMIFQQRRKKPASIEHLARLLLPLVLETEVLRDGYQKSIFTWRESM